MIIHNTEIIVLLALMLPFRSSLSFVSRVNSYRKGFPYSATGNMIHPLGMVMEDIRSSSSSSTNDSDRLVSITPLLQRNSLSPSSHYMSLGKRTRHLLKRQHWDEECFEEAQSVMEAWSHRQSRKAAVTVERIICRIVHERRVGNNGVQKIDMATMYTCAIRGWANSWEKGSAAQRAEEILDTMQLRYIDGHDRSIQPDIECFNLVLLAYARSGLPDAPEQALRVLEKLHDWHSNGSTSIRPNKESYATILRAYARSGKPDAHEHVKRLLEHLERLSEQEGYAEVKPNLLSHGAYFGALVDSLDRDYITGTEAAEKAEEYLFRMLSSPHEDVHPDSWCFNMVLTTWSRSGALEMMARAEAIMNEFEAYHERCGRTDKTKPNTNSYNCLITCYSRSSSWEKGDKAHAVLQKMHKLYNSGNNTSVRPDVVTYNTVMNAYAKSGQRDAPYKVEELLREMHDLYEHTGDMRVRPNNRSFNTCVDAWAKSNQPGAAARVMDWMVHMQENAEKQGRRSTRPNKWTFNAFLQALAKSGESTIGEEAEEVLDHMLDYYDKGWVEFKPDVLTFTNVIHCIAVSGREDSLERSLAIVRRMEDLHEKGYGDVRPNTYTYNCVINAAVKSKRPGKAQISLQILRRMQDVALRPLTATYNHVLNACAFANHPDEDVHEILDIAKLAFEEAKSTCGANFITYAAYVRVIGVFVVNTTKRVGMIQEIFRECCEVGQLNKLVMTQLKFSVPPRQYSQLRKEALDERTGKLREDYSMNARTASMLMSNRNVIE